MSLKQQLDKINENLDTIVKVYSKGVPGINKAAAQIVLDEARKIVPIGKTKTVASKRAISGRKIRAAGNLKRSLMIVKAKNGGAVVKADRDGYYIWFVTRGTKRSRANPFMDRALDNTIDRVQEYIVNELKKLT